MTCPHPRLRANKLRAERREDRPASRAGQRPGDATSPDAFAGLFLPAPRKGVGPIAAGGTRLRGCRAPSRARARAGRSNRGGRNTSADVCPLHRRHCRPARPRNPKARPLRARQHPLLGPGPPPTFLRRSAAARPCSRGSSGPRRPVRTLPPTVGRDLATLARLFGSTPAHPDPSSECRPPRACLRASSGELP